MTSVTVCSTIKWENTFKSNRQAVCNGGVLLSMAANLIDHYLPSSCFVELRCIKLAPENDHRIILFLFISFLLWSSQDDHIDVFLQLEWQQISCDSAFGLSFSVLFVCYFFLCRETNLKFKLGLRVTDERLQEERQLAEFDGELGSHYNPSLFPVYWLIPRITQTRKSTKASF